MATSTHTVGVQVLQALGLPATRCAGLTIKFEPNDVVVVEARYHPDKHEIDELTTIVAKLKPAP